MADDTRVTHPRLGLACVFALVCAIGFALPAVAGAGEPSATGEVVGQGPSDQIEDPYSRPVGARERQPAGHRHRAGLGRHRGRGRDGRRRRSGDLHSAPRPGGEHRPGRSRLHVPRRLHDHRRRRAWTTTGRTSRAWSPPAATNGIAIAGVAPEAKSSRVQAVNNCGETSEHSLREALDVCGRRGRPDRRRRLRHRPWPARRRGAPRNTTTSSPASSARYDDTLFVVPAGNEGNDNDAPAGLSVQHRRSGDRRPAPNLICVGATKPRRPSRCASATSGQHSVDLFAPGVGIYSTVRGASADGQLTGGTSAAAAIVARRRRAREGARPRRDPETVKYALMNSVGDPRTPGLIRSRSAADGSTPPAPSSSAATSARRARRDLGVVRRRPRRRRRRGGPVPGAVRADRTTAARTATATAGRDISDNCATTPNADQADADGDGWAMPAIRRRAATTPTATASRARRRVPDGLRHDGPNGCPEPVIPQPTATPTPTPTPTPTRSPAASVGRASA